MSVTDHVARLIEQGYLDQSDVTNNDILRWTLLVGLPKTMRGYTKNVAQSGLHKKQS